MKTFLILSALIIFSLLSTGCGEARAENKTAEPAPAAVYKAGHGVQFSPVAARIVDLSTGAVGSRDVATARNVTAIPTEALLRTVKGDFVYVSNGGWYLRTPVTVGASADGHYEIKDGLYEGDTIITRGTRALWLAELQAVNGGVGCADGH
jgi:hypothetical protein